MISIMIMIMILLLFLIIYFLANGFIHRGWVDIPLKSVANAQASDMWYPLGKRKAKDKVSGEVRMQITVFPIVSSLTCMYISGCAVRVVRARLNELKGTCAGER